MSEDEHRTRDEPPAPPGYRGPWREPRLISEIAQEVIEHALHGTPIPPPLPQRPTCRSYECPNCGFEGLTEPLDPSVMLAYCHECNGPLRWMRIEDAPEEDDELSRDARPF